MKTGAVWSFTTAVVIDDFESYTDDEGSRIYETWIDGFSTGLNGSTVGHINPPFAEQMIVHDANQSMPLDYNNVNAPFYSETERGSSPPRKTGPPAAPTRSSSTCAARSSTSGCRSTSGSRTPPKKSGAVVHPDAAVVTAKNWIEWKIPFSAFTASGVNMSRVKKVIVGVGDRADPKAGGKGLIYIDDIRITKP